MLKSSTVNAAEQLQVGQIPSKPALNPLFRLDCQNKKKTNNPSPTEATPSITPTINPVTIQTVSDAVIANSSVVTSHSRRNDSNSRSRSRSRQQRALKNMKGNKRSQESESEKERIKGVEMSKCRINKPKNVGSFSRRSSARLQQRAISLLQSPVQSDTKTPSNKSRLNVLESSNTLNGISQKKEDSSNVVIDKFYKTRICPQFLNGYCDREQRCTYAHGQQQKRQFQGACFKTKICYSFTQGRCPKKIGQCRFAHGAHDLRGSKDAQRQQMKMQEEKKSCSPQTGLRAIRKAKVQQQHFHRDNNNHGRRNSRNKMLDNRKMQEQFSDKQRHERQKGQKSFLQRQKNRQRQQFSKQSTSTNFSRPDYFTNPLNHQRQVPNVFRQQFQNMPVYGQPIMQSYPLNPQMLNYSLPDFHNYMMQMQMLQYMPQQPVNFYHQYPNFDNGMQPFQYRQFGQPSFPVANANNYNRGNQSKKQQTNLSTVDKKIGKSLEKGLEKY